MTQRYAIKLGDINLRSGKPITPEERREAINMLIRATNGCIYLGNGLKVELAVDRH